MYSARFDRSSALTRHGRARADVRGRSEAVQDHSSEVYGMLYTELRIFSTNGVSPADVGYENNNVQGPFPTKYCFAHVSVDYKRIDIESYGIDVCPPPLFVGVVYGYVSKVMQQESGRELLYKLSRCRSTNCDYMGTVVLSINTHIPNSEVVYKIGNVFMKERS